MKPKAFTKLLEKKENRPYDIICSNHFDDLGSHIIKRVKPSSICIVTDSHLASIHLNVIKAMSHEIAPTFVHVFEAGEESKNMHTITGIYDTLLTHKADRSSLIIALGGGVVGDIAGFAAATYMRGIPFIQIPTTFVAQNDSGIGGKVGVDYLEYKNIVGAFHNPLLVYTNVTVLSTLPKEELAGISEVIKHGLIHNPSLFHYLIEHKESILRLESEKLQEMTYMSAKVKCDIVEQDPKEQGIRKILNFGHTVGHAIETLSHFKYSHGECVAYGMCVAAFISYKRNLLALTDVKEIITLCKMFDLLGTIEDYDTADIWEHMSYDKKKSHGKVSFILLKNIGETVIVTDIAEKEIAEAMEFLKETCN